MHSTTLKYDYSQTLLIFLVAKQKEKPKQKETKTNNFTFTYSFCFLKLTLLAFANSILKVIFLGMTLLWSRVIILITSFWVDGDNKDDPEPFPKWLKQKAKESQLLGELSELMDSRIEVDQKRRRPRQILTIAKHSNWVVDIVPIKGWNGLSWCNQV